jgi:thymidine kinase
MELADSIEEIKSTCYFCNRKSILNLKHVNGIATLDGPSIQLGCEELYFPACYSCYRAQIEDAENLKKTAKTKSCSKKTCACQTC